MFSTSTQDTGLRVDVVSAAANREVGAALTVGDEAFRLPNGAPFAKLVASNCARAGVARSAAARCSPAAPFQRLGAGALDAEQPALVVERDRADSVAERNQRTFLAARVEPLTESLCSARRSLRRPAYRRCRRRLSPPRRSATSRRQRRRRNRREFASLSPGKSTCASVPRSGKQRRDGDENGNDEPHD